MLIENNADVILGPVYVPLHNLSLANQTGRNYMPHFALYYQPAGHLYCRVCSLLKVNGLARVMSNYQTCKIE